MSDEKHEPEHIPTRLLTDIRLCFAFFTRLPVKWPDGVPFSRLGPAMWAFPLVGWAVGALSLVVGVLTYMVIKDSFAAALLFLATGMLLTGAMHEDGLADVADGFGGGKDRASKLTIMKDSRIGTYGVLVLLLVISLKAQIVSIGIYGLSNTLYVLQVENPQEYWPDVLLLTKNLGLLLGAAAVSRALAVACMVYLSPAKEDGMGADAGEASFRVLVAAMTISALPLLLFLNPFIILGVLAAGMCGTGLFLIFTYRQIGGYTGDVIGAAQSVSETLYLFFVLYFISLAP